jgi:hypothetical protein
MTTPQVIDERRGATSASNAQADELCAGRFLAQKGLPEKSSDDANTGRLIHAALEKQDPAGLSLEQREIYDACREIEAVQIAKLWPTTSKAFIRREERLFCKVPGPDGKPLYDHSARLDCYYRTGVDAVIVEYKTGNNDAPESPRNLQLRDQAVLLARQPAALLQNIAVLVIQPLVTHSPEVTMYLPADIATAEQRMFERVRRSNDPNSPRTPGELQCKFCLAKSRCPEYQKFAGALVPQMTSLLDVPVESWTPEQRGQFLDRRKVAQDWLDNCEKAMKSGLADNPAFATGWTLAPGRVRETISNAQDCFARFLAAGGKQEDFMGTVSIVKGRLKEALAAATGTKGKALDAALKALLAGITETSTDAPTLKKADAVKEITT